MGGDPGRCARPLAAELAHGGCVGAGRIPRFAGDARHRVRRDPHHEHAEALGRGGDDPARIQRHQPGSADPGDHRQLHLRGVHRGRGGIRLSGRPRGAASHLARVSAALRGDRRACREFGSGELRGGGDADRDRGDGRRGGSAGALQVHGDRQCVRLVHGRVRDPRHHVQDVRPEPPRPGCPGGVAVRAVAVVIVVSLGAFVIQTVLPIIIQLFMKQDFINQSYEFFVFSSAGGEKNGLGFFIASTASNIIAQIVSFFINRDKTFNSDANIAVTLPIYIVFTIFLICFSAWLAPTFQGFLVSKGLTAELSTFISNALCGAIKEGLDERKVEKEETEASEGVEKKERKRAAKKTSKNNLDGEALNAKVASKFNTTED